MCEKKSGVEQIVDVDKITVWYCKDCEMLDIDTDTPIATLFQGIL